jgi:hypothetical protein
MEGRRRGAQLYHIDGYPEYPHARGHQSGARHDGGFGLYPKWNATAPIQWGKLKQGGIHYRTPSAIEGYGVATIEEMVG